MKLLLAVSIGLFWGSWGFSTENGVSICIEKPRTVLVAWSKGGGAHKAMLDSIKAYLKDSSYIVEAWNPFEETLASLDPIRKFTVHGMDGEEMYNFLLSKDVPWVTNKFYEFGLQAINRHRKRIEKLIEQHIIRTKPCLVISVIPMFNYEMASICHRHDIPFLLMAPDLNIENYFSKPVTSDFKNMHIFLPFDDKECMRLASKVGIESYMIRGIGLPLRPEFYAQEEKDIEAIKKDFDIPAGKPVVMMLMGGAGSGKMFNYIRALGEVKEPIHLVLCVGRNERIMKKIKRASLPPHITLSVVRFTKRISDLMAASDLLITKSGPTTISEAIAMRLPLLLDNTTTVLELEKMHLDFVEDKQIGQNLSRFKDLPRSINAMLFNKEYRKQLKENMTDQFDSDFPHKVVQIIDQLIDAAEVSIDEPQWSINGSKSVSQSR